MWDFLELTLEEVRREKNKPKKEKQIRKQYLYRFLALYEVKQTYTNSSGIIIRRTLSNKDD